MSSPQQILDLLTANHAISPTLSNTTDFAGGVISTGLYVGGAGDVKVTMAGGEDVTFTGLSAGSVYPIRVKRVWSTGTTATNLLVLW